MSTLDPTPQKCPARVKTAHSQKRGAAGLVMVNGPNANGSWRAEVPGLSPPRRRPWAYLGEVLLGDAGGPLEAVVQGAAGVGHIGALDQHPLDQSPALRGPEHGGDGLLVFIHFLVHEQSSKQAKRVLWATPFLTGLAPL